MIKSFIEQYWIIALVGLVTLAIVAFLFIRNQKDKKALIRKLNNDFNKAEEGDAQTGV